MNRMNKYASGYALTKALSFLGWIGVAASVIGGMLLVFNAPREIGIFGWIIAVTGSFQGLLLIGLGAIGEAVLDGSVAQQQLARFFVPVVGQQDMQFGDKNIDGPTEVREFGGNASDSSKVVETFDIQSSTGRIFSGLLLESGKFRIKKGGGFLEFENKQEAIDYINKG